MNKLTLLIASVFLTMVSCGLAPYYCNFSPLDGQRRIASAGAADSVAVTRDPDTAVSRCTLSDSLVDIRFFITMYQIEFTIRNKTGRTIRVDWEKCAYVNPRGVRKRVIHRGILYAQKDVVQHPGLIYKGESLSDILLPSDDILVYLYGSGGWSLSPIFSNADLGRTARAVFTVEIDGVPHEYAVRFVIKSV